MINIKVKSFFNVLIISLFWFGALFPYIRLFPIDADTQPTVLIVVLIYFTYKFILGIHKLRMIEILSLIAMLYLVIASFAAWSYDFRDFASLFAIFATLYFIDRKVEVTPQVAKFLEIAIYVYSVVAIIQMYFPHFTFLVINRVSELHERGSTSLTPEPSYYGVLCFFFFILVRSFHGRYGVYTKKKSIILQVILVLQCLVIAKSFWGLLIFLLFGLIYLICTISIFSVFMTSFLVCVALMLWNIIDLDNSTRIVKLFNDVLTNPGSLIMDGSSNQRFYNIVMPVFSVFDGIRGIIGHGAGTWSQYYSNHIRDYHSFFWLESPDARLMSGFGTLFFNMGFIGIIYAIILCFFHENSKYLEGFVQSLAVFFLMFGAVPLAYPLFALWVALMNEKGQQISNQADQN